MKLRLEQTAGAALIEAILVFIVVGLVLGSIVYAWLKVEEVDDRIKARSAINAIRGQGIYTSSSMIVGTLSDQAIDQTLESMMRMINFSTYDGKNSLPICLYLVKHEFAPVMGDCSGPNTSEIVASINSDYADCPVSNSSSLLGSGTSSPPERTLIIEQSKKCLLARNSCASKVLYAYAGFLAASDYQTIDISAAGCGLLGSDIVDSNINFYPYNPL